MPEFLKTQKRRPFKVRIQQIGDRLNKQGKVTVDDIVLNEGLSPQYAKTLLIWASKKYTYAKFVEESGELVITSRQDMPPEEPQPELTTQEEKILEAGQTEHIVTTSPENETKKKEKAPKWI